MRCGRCLLRARSALKIGSRVSKIDEVGGITGVSEKSQVSSSDNRLSAEHFND